MLSVAKHLVHRERGSSLRSHRPEAMSPVRAVSPTGRNGLRESDTTKFSYFCRDIICRYQCFTHKDRVDICSRQPFNVTCSEDSTLGDNNSFGWDHRA